MRRFGLLAAVLTLATGRLAAQHAGQVEVGAFGSYTSYDATFGLAHKIGGGVRMGYLLGSIVGVEADVLFQPEYTVTPPGGTTSTLEPLIGSASRVINAVHANRLMVYVLCAYSLLHFGTRPPYGVTADGVPDGIDQCPGTPAGAHVDAKGCPVDSDGDGVPDGVDQCPNTPPGVAVDAAGCPLDSDKDGVPDGIDKCPNTPAGATVDASGCPLATDLDAVPDGIDHCPNTPAGTKVDAVGCPLPVEAVKPPSAAATPTPPGKCPPAPPGSQVDANGCLILFAPEAARSPTPGAPPRPTLVLTGVNFETGRSILTRDSYMVLDAVAASLVANPDIRIEVAGYTDSTGRKFTNLRLSQGRAAAVRFYLARKGVPPLRMVVKGYGASGYIAPNNTAAGRAQNRRVELHKLP